MPLLSLLSGLLVFVLAVAVFYPIGAKSERLKKRLNKLEETVDKKIDEELSLPFVQRFLLPFLYEILRVVSKIFPKKKKDKQNSAVSKLEKDLKLSGIRLNANEFTAARLIIFIFFMCIAILILMLENVPLLIKVLTFTASLIMSILIPNYYLKSNIKKRQESIRIQMPDILDLLSVSVEAGLGFDAALVRVSEKATGPLVDELSQVYREIQMGRPRKDALRDFGERSTIPEIKTFAGSLVQAEQLGISLKNVLKAQSQQLRISRRQRAEEKAMKAPVKMMLPLVIFIFPVVFLILLGPSVIEIIKTFRK